MLIKNVFIKIEIYIYIKDCLYMNLMTHREETLQLLSEIINDKNITKKIEEGINCFVNEYLEINNTPIFLFEQIYKNKANEIINILSLSDNITKLIINKKILPEKIAFMKDEELFPEKYEDIFKKKEIQNLNNENKGSSAFECKKCHERSAEISQKQTRSGDEPPTTFITCLKCGYKYKFG